MPGKYRRSMRNPPQSHKKPRAQLWVKIPYRFRRLHLQARETAQVQKAIASASDVRTDRVREVKEKLARGDYDNLSNEVLNTIAAKLTTAVKAGQ
jgi:anti-sigma28 factor (negative regulator of flagellin synthesis)